MLSVSGKIVVLDFDAQIIFAFAVDVDIGRGDNGAVFLDRERQTAVVVEKKLIFRVVEMPDGEQVESNRVADDNRQIQSQRVERGDEARRRADGNFLIVCFAFARQAQGDYSQGVVGIENLGRGAEKGDIDGSGLRVAAEILRIENANRRRDEIRGETESGVIRLMIGGHDNLVRRGKRQRIIDAHNMIDGQAVGGGGENQAHRRRQILVRVQPRDIATADMDERTPVGAASKVIITET